MDKKLKKSLAILIMMVMVGANTAIGFADDTVAEESAASEPTTQVVTDQQNFEGASEEDAEPAEEATEENATVEESTVEETEAVEELEFDQQVYVNPLYEDVISKKDIVKEVGTEPEPSKNDSDSDVMMLSADDVEYFTSTSAAGNAMRSGLVNRDSEISVGIQYKTVDAARAGMKSGCKELIEQGMKHTGNPTEGDYIKWQYKGWSASISPKYNYNTGGYDVIFKFRMSYFSTAAQEKAITEKVNQYLDGMDLEGKTEYQKTKAIYDCICKNVVYDYAGAKDDSNTICHSAYAAVVKNKAVCQGYALMFYRMALQEGIDNRIVVGIGSSGNHAWNYVKVSGKYYQLDSTWDAGRSSYKYFLAGKTFADHSGKYKIDTSVSGYSISSTAYGVAANTVSKSPSSTSISKLTAGKKKFTVKWNKKSNNTGYQIRYSKKSSMKGASTKTYTSKNTTSATVSKLSAKKKYYVQVRTYSKVDGKTYYSSWSAKKSVKTKK